MTESEARRQRAHAEQLNPTHPVTWFDTDGGLNKDCPRCKHPLDSWHNPPAGQHWHTCPAGKGGCGAFWDRVDGALVSSLGPCQHRIYKAEAHSAALWRVRGTMPPSTESVGEDVNLIRYTCLCGAFVFQEAPAWEQVLSSRVGG